MSYFMMMFLGFLALRAVIGGGYHMRRRWDRWERWEGSSLLDQKVAKLEGLVSELQEQVEEDRVLLHRLEEERDFLRQLYPAQEEPRA